jgi:hypothetical protein
MQTTTNKVEPKVSMAKVNLADVKVGDLFSETSHYVCTAVGKVGMEFKHLESGDSLTLSSTYVQNLLSSANQFTNTVTVGKEDKYWTVKQIADAKAKGELSADSTVREGDIRVEGIRTIWENIRDTRVFTVCFVTQGKELSKKEFDRLRGEQIQEAITEIDTAAKSKKGVANAARKVLEKVQANPISQFAPGVDRVLIGYKDQFISRDGKYNCVDTQITDTHNIRPVNINTIKWLVVDGVMYVVE